MLVSKIGGRKKNTSGVPLSMGYARLSDNRMLEQASKPVVLKDRVQEEEWARKLRKTVDERVMVTAVEPYSVMNPQAAWPSVVW